MPEQHRGLTRRQFLVQSLGATAAVLSSSALLTSDRSEPATHALFQEWRNAIPGERDIPYSPLWQQALNRIQLSTTNEMKCEHRSNTLERTLRVCTDPTIQYLEVDLRVRRGSVVAAHHPDDTVDMDLDLFQECVEGAERQLLPKIVKYDPKGRDDRGTWTYERIKDQVAQANGERPYIMNFNPFAQYAYDISDWELEEKCFQYPNAIWSIGHDLEHTYERRARILSVHERLHEQGGGFTLPINVVTFAQVRSRNAYYFNPLIKEGVHFTFYYKDGKTQAPSWAKESIMTSSLLPWQCIFDFV